MSALQHIADLIGQESGIVIKPGQLASLAAALNRVAPGVVPADILRRLADPAVGEATLARLIDEVTVNESFFFRHMRELQPIDWRDLLRNARSAGDDVVRVWSAACACGEEPYTLAILAAEAFGTMEPPVRILGTDICTTALERARAARYGRRAVREIPEPLRRRYLQPAGGGYQVVPSLHRLVDLQRRNIARSTGLPTGEQRFDLILCRNVLIYFDAATVERTCAGLEGALRPGGKLVLGAADRLSDSSRCAAPAKRRQRPRRKTAGGAPQQRRARPAPAAPAPLTETGDERLAEALRQVDEWSLDATIQAVDEILESDPLNIDAYFVRGVAQLACGDATGAVASLRRALYLDPQFGLAAFKLGRAHETLGERDAARRAYARALKTLDVEDQRPRAVTENVSVADVLQACRARVTALARA